MLNMQKRPARIFVADDQRDVLEALRLLLKGEGYATESFNHPTALLDALRTQAADAVLMDLNYTRDTTSGEEGLDAIARIRAFDAYVPIVVMTAWGTIELAVEAMRRGAQDFVEKPWDNARLLTVMRTQVALGQALRRTRALEDEHRQMQTADGDLVANSRAMLPVMETIAQVAPSNANVLVTGESGTGKGVVARMIHERSPRKDKSLVVVNIGALAETVFESEMFGHVKGAFTDAKSDRVGRFELADGGTLFLDEIANIPMAQQARLLRVLEDGEYERLGSSRTLHTDVRVIAATNADLDEEIEGGRFRKDLLFRLNTIHIHLPPLRDREEDLVELAQRFLVQFAARHRCRASGFTDAALGALKRYPWPGNVRELSHVIERAVLLCRGSAIQPADLRLDASPHSSSAAPSHGPQTLDEVEHEAIAAALRRHDGNVVAAAEELGVSRSALYRRMEKFGL